MKQFSTMNFLKKNKQTVFYLIGLAKHYQIGLMLVLLYEACEIKNIGAIIFFEAHFFPSLDKHVIK